MNARHTLMATLVVAVTVASPAHAGGIFWDTPEQTRSSADWGSGTGGGSALGQLEAITGQTVDRSAPQASLPARAASAPSRASAAQARANTATLQALTAGVMVFSILQAMDAQQDAQARAAAEAERRRQLEAERQRQARLQSAARQRAAWESQDAQDSADLGSVLSGSGGTSFFGTGAAVNPATLKQSSPAIPAADLAPAFVPPPPLPFQARLLEKGQSFVRDTAKDLAKKAVIETVGAHAKNSKNALEYMDRANSFIDDLFKVMAPETVVKALADSDPASAQALLSRLDRVSARAHRLAFNADAINNGEIEALARLSDGKVPTAEEIEAIVEERARTALVDAIWKRFTGAAGLRNTGDGEGEGGSD